MKQRSPKKSLSTKLHPTFLLLVLFTTFWEAHYSWIQALRTLIRDDFPSWVNWTELPLWTDPNLTHLLVNLLSGQTCPSQKPSFSPSPRFLLLGAWVTNPNLSGSLPVLKLQFSSWKIFTYKKAILSPYVNFYFPSYFLSYSQVNFTSALIFFCHSSSLMALSRLDGLWRVSFCLRIIPRIRQWILKR